jgi:hypothetical protein
MAAALNVSVVDGAPGNLLLLTGSGLLAGAGASVTLSNQGVTAAPNLIPSTIVLPNPTFLSSSVMVPLPDSIMDGTITVTAADATVATCSLRVRSQYVQADEYVASGDGWDTSNLAPNELDTVLRRASARCDTFMGHSLRQLQVKERHRWRAPRNGQPPRLFPWRVRGRKCPIISIDQLTFVSAMNLVTVFNPVDMYNNVDLGYIEVLAYAVGNYALLGALEVIGYSANIFELSFTSGYPMAQYPSAVMDATMIVASSMLEYRNAMRLGLGGLKTLGKDLPVSQESFLKMPGEAKVALGPYVTQMVG